MRHFKIILILICFFLYIVTGLVFHLLLLPFGQQRRWQVLNHLTCVLIQCFRWLLGIKITIDGDKKLLSEGGQLIISRHIGYIDGLVLGGMVPLTFVSKSEIRKWPLIGWVVRVSGTIFVDRQNKSRILQPLRDMESRLKEDLNVLIFPEGTSTDGTRMNPFQTAFFAAPIAARADIIPIIIEYCRIDGKTLDPDSKEIVCWYGTKPFFSHLWNLLKYKRIDVRVTVKEKIRTADYSNTSADRKRLSQHCHDVIRNSVHRNISLFEGLATDACVS
jgi:1-acyl-sn-glycerol-3-phosphate acyltransferase